MGGATVHPIGGGKWQPHTISWTETPALFFLKPILRYWISFRNQLLRNPLLCWRFPFPCLGSQNYAWTLGEILLFLIFVIGTIGFLIYGYLYSHVIRIEGSGLVATVPMMLAFVLATRNSIFTLLLGIPFERQLFWHKLMALITLLFGALHGWIALHVPGTDPVFGIKFAEPVSKFFKPEEEAEADEYLSGYVCWLAMALLAVLSLWFIRRYFFNGFYFVHVVLALVALVAGILHGATLLGLGAALWGADIAIRYLFLTCLRNKRSCTAVRHPANVVRLTFHRGDMEYGPGQYLFVMVPSVNPFEWHPFSISSSPHEETVSIHIRVLGNWTKSLYDYISKKGGGPMHLTAFFEGPYGSPEVDIHGDKYKTFLLISGGIGITPMQSVCNHLVHQMTSQNRPIKKIWFVWSCADKYMVNATFEHDRSWGIAQGKTNTVATVENGHPVTANGQTKQNETNGKVESVANGYHKTPNEANEVAIVEKLPNGLEANGKDDDDPNLQGLPLSFQPDSLTRKRGCKWLSNLDAKNQDDGTVDPDEERLHTEFYLTRVKDKRKFSGAGIREDMMQHLRFGRPDLGKIFVRMRQYCKMVKEDRVAVMVCGPRPMVNDARRLCSVESSNGVSFDFHGEEFEF